MSSNCQSRFLCVVVWRSLRSFSSVNLVFLCVDVWRSLCSFSLQVPNTLHQLTDNCRSHDGILRLAAGVLDLLAMFFPESLDKLERDRGLLEGPKPVLLESASPDELITLLRGNRRETSHIEFGAHQVRLDFKLTRSFLMTTQLEASDYFLAAVLCLERGNNTRNVHGRRKNASLSQVEFHLEGVLNRILAVHCSM